jgi:membrane protein
MQAITRSIMEIGKLLKSAAKNWSDDNISTLSGSLAYSTVFSIAPLLVITMGVVGLVSGDNFDGRSIFESIGELVGSDGAKAIEGMVRAASKRPKAGIVATVTGIVVLLIGASSVFADLQSSLNVIWKVRSAGKSGVTHFLKQRLLSFSMILVIAFLLLISLVVSTAVSAMGSFMKNSFPGEVLLWQFLNITISLGVITLLFAAMFKVLPDVLLKWNEVIVGAFATSVLFTIGKTLIGLYLGQSSIGSAYGAAGSVVIILVWVYYSSAIMFFGAEFTRAYVIRDGREVLPVNGAEIYVAETKES